MQVILEKKLAPLKVLCANAKTDSSVGQENGAKKILEILGEGLCACAALIRGAAAGAGASLKSRRLQLY